MSDAETTKPQPTPHQDENKSRRYLSFLAKKVFSDENLRKRICERVADVEDNTLRIHAHVIKENAKNNNTTLENSDKDFFKILFDDAKKMPITQYEDARWYLQVITTAQEVSKYDINTPSYDEIQNLEQKCKNIAIKHKSLARHINMLLEGFENWKGKAALNIFRKAASKKYTDGIIQESIKDLPENEANLIKELISKYGLGVISDERQLENIYKSMRKDEKILLKNAIRLLTPKS